MASKVAQTKVPLPFAVTSACRALGERVSIARKRRRLTQKELAKRAGLSTFTVIRIEKGVPSTELGSIVRVLWALGLDAAVAKIADSTTDEVGQALERSRLPKRVSQRKERLDDDF
jgi:transcriptional regulator with XRE-family HTH domain